MGSSEGPKRQANIRLVPVIASSSARKNENDSASSESEGKQEAPGTESRRSQSGITAAMKTRMYRRRHSSDKSELREAASTEEVESDAIRVEETDCGETTSDQQVPAAGGGKDSRLLVPFAKRRRRGTHTALKHAIRRARKQLGEPPLASIAPEPNENPSQKAVI
nr:unnamed protein product [Spirometra erinaceieuropaei]